MNEVTSALPAFRSARYGWLSGLSDNLQRSMLASPEQTLRDRASARSRELLRLAERHYARPMPKPEIGFDLRGQAAGQARLIPGGRSRIRYNPVLLRENPDAFLAQTVAHEVAHLVAFERFGSRIRPHGPEWQAVMRLFGAEPRRCHDFDVERATRRRLTRHAYHCACRTHQLTSVRHNRARRGQTYLCRTCRQPLAPGALPEDAP